MKFLLLFIQLGYPYLGVIEKPPEKCEGLPYLTYSRNFVVTIIDQDIEKTLKNQKIPYQKLTSYEPETQYYLGKIRKDFYISDSITVLYRNEDELILKEPIKGLNTRNIFIKKIPDNLHYFEETPEINEKPSLMQDLIQDMVQEVNQDSYLLFLQTLQDFVSRNSMNVGCSLAAVYSKGYMTNQGIDSVYLDFYNGTYGDYAPNVVGIKFGEVDSYYAITAHLDATAGLPWWNEPVAPGADDNGSGSSAVLEAFRVIQPYNFHYSIRFMHFTGEEQGLEGSGHYASNHSGDPILGVLNLDMIGYVDALPESLDIVSNSPSQWLMDTMVTLIQTYVPGLLTKEIVDPGFWYSDHSSFWDIGKPAILGIEDVGVPNPYYHSEGDTIGSGFNNLPFATDVTRAGVALIASLARPITPNIKEKYLSPINREKISSIRISFSEKTLRFTIPFSWREDEIDEIHIFKASGQKILEMPFVPVISIVHWKSGVYFIHLLERGKAIKKFKIFKVF